MVLWFGGVIGEQFDHHRNHETAMNLTTSEITKMGLAVGLCFAAYKFIGHPAVRTGAVAIAAVIVAKRLPYVGDALA